MNGRSCLSWVCLCLTTSLGAAEPAAAPSSLRPAIAQAVELLKKHDTVYPDRFAVPTDDEQRVAFLDELIRIQKEVAWAEYELTAHLLDIERLDKARVLETRRWQATGDYVTARMQLRIASLREYNAMLGRMRRGDVPVYDPARHDGWQLATRVGASSLAEREADHMGRKARSLLEKLAREHKGTPWELLARRELLTPLGLEWQPVAR